VAQETKHIFNIINYRNESIQAAKCVGAITQLRDNQNTALSFVICYDNTLDCAVFDDEIRLAH
jgi:hypothetical protein